MVDLSNFDKYPGLMNSVSCEGDSLTFGTGSANGMSYPNQLQAMMQNRLVQTFAIVGQTAQRCAARQGSETVYLTLSGNAFNGTAAVTCTLNTNPSNTANGQLLSTGTDTLTRYMSGTVNGIQCFLTRTQPAGSEVYTITPYKSTSAVVPAGSVFIPDESVNALNTIQVMWWGRNNVPNLLAGVADLYNNAIAIMAIPRRYIIMGILPALTEIIGTQTYSSIFAVNSQLAATWGANFIPMTPPTTAEMAAIKYTPTSQDLIDIANGVFPVGMRFDNVHLNTIGYAIIAMRVYNKINFFGW